MIRRVLSLPVVALLAAAPCLGQYKPDPVEVRAGIGPERFHLPPGLEVKVWAKAPQFFNPTNIDVDHLGRVWVAEAVNYRLFNNSGKQPLKHPDGDRVMVLEDADGDGVAEKSHVFVQDKELTAPLGIAVFGNRVVVSCAPNILIYTDVNGDAKFDPALDKKDTFLTGFGGFDHDHGLHAVFAGPDGLWHLNAGNAGPHVVTDRSGWTLRAGSSYTGGTPYNTKNLPGAKSDDGRVYVGGVAARIRPDGKGLTVYAHNFRNNYEHCVTSGGDVFQNDNDDEVMSCRTTWLMEHANAGFASADGTRSWRADKRPWQSIQTAHWHQEDPGVVPSGDVYGAGSPTGMTVYENGAIGPTNGPVVLSCEAGRNVVWAYEPEPSGAGFVMRRSPFLSTVKWDDPEYKWDKREADTGKWFRPSDVAVGPDGAIYVSDWFDPVVGGHQMDDKVGTGTIYRVAPKGKKLAVPKLDLSTTQGQIAALGSPAVNVRFLGFERLLARGAGSEEAVAKVLEDPEADHYLKARAVWLLAQVSHGGRQRVRQLLQHRDLDVHLLAFRALWRAGDNVMPHAPALASHELPAVRREVALAMRDVPLEECREVLLTIASRYDGKDRWYLEALGTGCDGKEEAIYPALLEKLGETDPLKWSEAFANITWRLHPPSALSHSVIRARATSLSLTRRQQAIDTIAFTRSADAAAAMVELASSAPEDVRERATWWVNFRRTNDWASLDPAVAATPDRPAKPVFASGVVTSGPVKIDVDVSGATHLWLVADEGRNGMSCDWADWGQPRLVGPKGELRLTELKWLSANTGFGDVNVDRNCKGRPMKIAGRPVPFGIGTHSNSEIVFELPPGYTRFVAEAGIDNGGPDGGTDFPGGNPDVEFLVYANSDPQRAAALAMRQTLLDSGAPRADRQKAAEQLAQSPDGGAALLSLAAEGKLPAELKAVVADQIFRNPDPSIRALASQHFERKTAGGTPLPPVDKLLATKGDAARGRDAFFGTRAACSRCHAFGGEGSDVGPDLTEIRNKYDGAALLDQVLNPSAAILLGYEPWIVRTKRGETHLGFILAEGQAGLTLKDTAGKKVFIPARQVDRRVRQKLSVMPDNVALGLEPQEIADLLEFLRAGPKGKQN